ncbi:MAG: hypothetical protein JSV49_02995, partial [Thermoplasmata archaeon]
MKIYNCLLKTECLSEEIIRKIQYEKLLRVLKYTQKYVPYYRKKFNEIGFDFREVKAIDDFKKIPSLSRQEVIDFHKEMVDCRLQSSIPIADKSQGDPGIPIPFARFRKHKLVKKTSS